MGVTSLVIYIQMYMLNACSMCHYINETSLLTIPSTVGCHIVFSLFIIIIIMFWIMEISFMLSWDQHQRYQCGFVDDYVYN